MHGLQWYIVDRASDARRGGKVHSHAMSRSGGHAAVAAVAPSAPVSATAEEESLFLSSVLLARQEEGLVEKMLSVTFVGPRQTPAGGSTFGGGDGGGGDGEEATGSQGDGGGFGSGSSAGSTAAPGASAGPLNPRWKPAVEVSLAECRVTAHRVWPTDTRVCPPAVVVADVSRSGAGRQVLLRSNVTIHNPLRCAVRVRFDTLHSAESLGRRRGSTEAEEVSIDSGRTHNVPLHLTSGTSIRVRPVPPGEVHDPAPPFPCETDARLDDLTREARADATDDDEHDDHVPTGRALVVLHRKRTAISHPTWGPVPDIVITVLPKFAIENRLPIGLQFRLTSAAPPRGLAGGSGLLSPGLGRSRPSLERANSFLSACDADSLHGGSVAAETPDTSGRPHAATADAVSYGPHATANTAAAAAASAAASGMPLADSAAGTYGGASAADGGQMMDASQGRAALARRLTGWGHAVAGLIRGPSAGRAAE
eukprot:scaffold2020_cov107-Isochrysis_galbana.AAC.1